MPCPVTHIANDRLNKKSCQRRGEKQNGDLVRISAKTFIDATHVGSLEIPAELNTEEPNAHVDDLSE